MSKAITELFGERVRLFREELRYSQETLGELCGLSRAYISDIERGLRNVSLATAAKLARSLEMPVGELVDVPDPVKTAPPATVSALSPEWASECLTHAKNRADFNLLFATPDKITFMKDLAEQFGYAFVKCGNAIAMVCLKNPPAPAGKTAKTKAKTNFAGNR